jgi:hypothetical protein
MRIWVQEAGEDWTDIAWEPAEKAESYRVYWSDRYHGTTVFKQAGETGETRFRFRRGTHVPYYLYAEAVIGGRAAERTDVIRTPVKKKLRPQLEKLNRGEIRMTNGYSHIGLNNVKERLSLMYPSQSTFTIISQEGEGTTIFFSVPYRR